ncbi:MAG: cupin domain-containing protein [Promethearchaeota archaeon]|nr:MAG: cupin domain-containing protein [Candidatus Lokiarchaeota archaeon]
MKKGPHNKEKIEAVNPLPGIYRKTLSYNDNVMLCHFLLEADAKIPLHDHDAHQIGYVISGKIKFLTETRGNFIAEAGDSYVFDGMEKHGAEIIETAEVIEVFSPTREEYK